MKFGIVLLSFCYFLSIVAVEELKKECPLCDTSFDEISPNLSSLPPQTQTSEKTPVRNKKTRLGFDDAKTTVFCERWNAGISATLREELAKGKFAQTGFAQIPISIALGGASSCSKIMHGLGPGIASRRFSATNYFEEQEFLRQCNAQKFGSARALRPFLPSKLSLEQVKTKRAKTSEGNLRINSFGIICRSTVAEEHALKQAEQRAHNILTNPNASVADKQCAKDLLRNLELKETSEARIEKYSAEKVHPNVLRNAVTANQQITYYRNRLEPGSVCVTPITAVYKTICYEKTVCQKREQELVLIIENYNKKCAKITSALESKKEQIIVSQAQSELHLVRAALAEMKDKDHILARQELSSDRSTVQQFTFGEHSLYDFLQEQPIAAFNQQCEKAIKYDGSYPINYQHTPELVDQAKLKYAYFVRSNEDVKKIAHNTGFSLNQIQIIKHHLMIDSHVLNDDNGGCVNKQFCPDINIANAWDRLQTREYTDQDIALLQHEYYEAYLMKQKGLNYAQAHAVANAEIPLNKYELKAPSQEPTIESTLTKNPESLQDCKLSQYDGPKDANCALPGVALKSEITSGGITAPEPLPTYFEFPGTPIIPELLETQTVENATKAIKDALPGLKEFGNQSTKLDQYIADITFEEGVAITQENTSPNKVSIKEKDGSQVIIFEYDDGNIVVREISKGIPHQDIAGLPTIQVQPADKNKQQTKIRLSGNKEVVP